MRVAHLLVLSLFLLFLAAPTVVSAANAFTPYWGPIVTCAPCGNWCAVFKTAQNLARLGMTLVVFALMPLMFAIGAIMIMVSGFSDQANLLKQGQQTCLWAAGGGAMALGAYVIITTILWAFGNPSTGGVSWPNIVC